MNEITKTENKNTNLQVSKEQQVLMPIAESYIAMFPNKENDTTKQNIISMALKLSETKDKAGRPAIEVCTKESKNTNLQVSKEQQVLMPIAEQYIQLFPEIANDKTFNAKQAIISMALKLKETKDKAGRPAIDVCTRESIAQVAQELLVKRLDPLKSQVSLIVRGDK